MEPELKGRFELRILGPADLRDPHGREVAAVLVQPKRLALLCYLAQASPHGFHRRDELLALFWGERSDARARHALSQSLHFLRQHLGTGAVLSRGCEEIGLDADRVWCDAAGFDHALATGMLEKALGFYRGNLLDAFFVSEAPEFEPWLAAERARLRSRALDAALRLSDGARRAGDIETAVRWAQWAVARVPEDEAAARRLAECLDAAGDRAAAVQALEQYVEWLDRELAAEPASATLAVLRSLHSHDPATAQRQGGPRDPPAPHAPPASAMRPRDPVAAVLPRTDELARPPERPVRAGLAWVVAVVVVIAGAGTAYQRLAPPAAQWSDWRGGGVEETTVAVLRFAFHGSDATSYLPAAIAELLGRGLDGAGGIQAIDPQATAGLASSADTDGGTRRLIREVGDRFRAGSFLTGSVTETQDRIRLSATWYGRGGRRMAAATSEGPTAELFAIVDRLAAELLAGVHPGYGDQLVRSAARATGSLAALKPFIEGETQLRDGGFAMAAASFRRAVAADSTFAFAWYRLSIAAEYVGDAQLAYDAAGAAVRHGHGLQPADQALLEAFLAARRGDAERAEFLYRQIVVLDPSNVEGWFQLAEVQFHYGPLNGRPAQESKRAWQAVLELEPDNIAARYHLARVLALDEDWNAVSRLTTATAVLSPGHERVAAMRAMESMGLGDSAVERVALQLQPLDDATLYMAVFDAITYGGNPHAACRLAALLTQPTRPPDMRAWGHLWLAHLELASGRWRAAQDELDRLEAFDPLAAVEYGTLLALHPLLEPGTVDVQRLRHRLRLAGATRAPATSGDFPSASHAELRPHLYTYLLALLEARWGDPSQLEPAAAAIERAAATGAAAALLPRSLRAFGAALRDEPARAREQLDDAMACQWYELGRWSGFLGHCQNRWLMADIQGRLGRHREALRWYEAMRQTSPLDVILLAPAALRSARIHGQLGDAVSEAAGLARFAQLWGGADPELRACLSPADVAGPLRGWEGTRECRDWFAP
jgi:DNA-binding SARP family transcriptional activator/TolB-like protein